MWPSFFILFFFLFELLYSCRLSMLIVHGQVFFQDAGDGQLIRAAAGALAAFFAEAH
jgi:hypothetical protein